MYWNQQLNLVGRQQTVERIHHHHLLDSLILTPLLKEFTEVCDVGSGAGFPALCWAIARDDFQVTLVEKSPKKASFLTCAVEELNLTSRVKVLCERVEQIQLKSKLISCRALTSISDFLKITDHLGSPDSKWWLLKAKNETIDQELVCVDQSKWSVTISPLIHPTQDVTRNLVEVRRKK